MSSRCKSAAASTQKHVGSRRPLGPLLLLMWRARARSASWAARAQRAAPCRVRRSRLPHGKLPTHSGRGPIPSLACSRPHPPPGFLAASSRSSSSCACELRARVLERGSSWRSRAVSPSRRASLVCGTSDDWRRALAVASSSQQRWPILFRSQCFRQTQRREQPRLPRRRLLRCRGLATTTTPRPAGDGSYRVREKMYKTVCKIHRPRKTVVRVTD